MSRRWVVVEPHADDAFLSLGGHMEHWIKLCGDHVTIVTVYGNQKRIAEGASYAAAIGADHWHIDVEESGCVKSPAPELHSPKFERVLAGLCPAGSDVTLLVPLLDAHAEHTEVRRFVDARARDRRVLYYMDQPYASKVTMSAQVSEAMFNKRIYSYLRPTARKYRHIPIFKSQSLFFFYNGVDELKYTTELIVYKD